MEVTQIILSDSDLLNQCLLSQISTGIELF